MKNVVKVLYNAQLQQQLNKKHVIKNNYNLVILKTKL